MTAAPDGARMRRPVRLLHTSDVHLGAYDSSRDGSESRARLEQTFTRVIDLALRREVDLVLIAGDFFDNARVREETLQFAARQLARAEVPVILAPGNHDPIGPASVYDRFDFAAAPNLRLMREPAGESVAIEALDIEVWGRSHTEQDPAFTPFAGAPGRGQAAWQIGIGHGHFIHPRAAMQHSFHIREHDLQAFDRDYVALGHWERMTRVAGGHVTAAYSGAPLGLGAVDPLGGRVILVDLLADGGVRLTAESLGDEPSIPHDELPYLEGA